jgi:acyl-CoA thioesterase
MTTFDDDTALHPLGDGRFEGRISPDWSIVRGANGGHVAAILLRGIRDAVDDGAREPRSLTVHFARVPGNDRFEIETTVERTGRTTSNVSARFVQNGKLIALAIAVLSTGQRGPEFSDLAMPEVPRPADIEPVTDRDDFPFGRRFDFRRALGPDVGETSDSAEIGVWMRLREHQAVDHVVATQLMDAFAPAVFAKLGTGGGGAGVPTVEMTFHFRESLPLAGEELGAWYLGVYRTLLSRGGFIEEDGWLWSEHGVLVAQSRQLALLVGAEKVGGSARDRL